MAQEFDAVIRLRDQVTQKLGKIEQKIAAHQQAWERMGRSIQKQGEKIKSVGDNLTAKITAPIAAASVASFKLAADFEDALGATDQVFSEASSSVKKWADEMPSYYGVAKNEALSYVNTMGSLLQNIGGLSKDQAATTGENLVQLAGDLSAMYGGDVPSAVQALTGALKGNYAMLDNYGMGINATVIKQKAFEMGLSDGKSEMDLATKQAVALKLIMEQTGSAQGQAGREAKGASGSWKTMTTELKNASIALGQELIPMVTPYIQKMTQLIQKFKGLSPEQRNFIVKAALIAAAIGPILSVTGRMVIGVGKLIPLFSKTSKVVSGASKAFSFITKFMTPQTLIIMAIVGALILLYKNWDKVKEFVTRAVDVANLKIKEFEQNTSSKMEAMKNSINEKLTAIKGFFSEKFGDIKTDVENKINGIIATAENLLNIIGDSRIVKFLNGGQSKSVKFGRVGQNAKGTRSWRGGLTTVHEKGGEIIDLKRGARVYPHDESVQMAYQDGLNASTVDGSSSVKINIEHLAVREEADVNRVVDEIMRRLKLASQNRAKVVVT